MPEDSDREIGGTEVDFKGTSSATTKQPAYIVATSHPEELGRHDISDEELEMVTHAPPDRLWEVMMMATGVFIGSLLPAATALYSAYITESRPLTIEDTVQIALFAASLAAGLVCWHGTRGRKSAIEKKKDEIRARPSHKAMLFASDATGSSVTDAAKH